MKTQRFAIISDMTLMGSAARGSQSRLLFTIFDSRKITKMYFCLASFFSFYYFPYINIINLIIHEFSYQPGSCLAAPVPRQKKNNNNNYNINNNNNNPGPISVALNFPYTSTDATICFMDLFIFYSNQSFIFLNRINVI